MTYISTKLKKEFSIDEIITVHYFEYMKDFIFTGESHDFWEFLYVDKGEVSVQAENEFYQLSSGDIIFHKPNEFHALQATGSKAPNLVAISFKCFSPSMKFFENKYCTLTPKERYIISQVIEEGRCAFSTPLHIPSVEQVEISEQEPFGAQQLILSYLETFLIRITREHWDLESNIPYTPISSSLNMAATSNRLNQIIQYFECHICEQLTVADICNEFSISRSTLHALFHKEKECGAIDYFSLMKIERAKEIMRNQTMNFTEIAFYLSYSSLQYFSKQFKKTVGMSPLDYLSSIKKFAHTGSAWISHSKDSPPPPYAQARLKGCQYFLVGLMPYLNCLFSQYFVLFLSQKRSALMETNHQSQTFFYAFLNLLCFF